MKFITNKLVLITASILLYACPQSLTPQMKAEMQIMYYLREAHTDSLYRPGDFSKMSEVLSGKDEPTVVETAKYKILHTYTVDGEARKDERKSIFYIDHDNKVVSAEDIK